MTTSTAADDEEKLLSLLLSPQGITWNLAGTIEEVLPSEALFSSPSCRAVYASIRAVLKAQGRYTSEEVLAELKRSPEGWDSFPGGDEAYRRLCTSIPPSQPVSLDEVRALACRVRRRAVLRGCAAIGRQLEDLASSPEAETLPEEELLDRAERAVRRLSLAFHPDTARPLPRWLPGVLGEMAGRARNPLPSFPFLGPLVPRQEGDLVVVGGRPGVGKTALVCSLAYHLGVLGREPVLFFSCETSAGQVVRRLLALASRIPLQRIMAGEVHDEDWPALESLAAVLMRADTLWIDSTPFPTAADIAAQVRYFRHTTGGSIAIVDGFQRIRGNLREASAALAELAMALRLTVIVTSQLSGEAEKRDGRRPTLADLGAETPALEQDASSVVLLWREEMGEAGSGLVTFPLSRVHLLVVKNRYGPVGERYADFDTVSASFRLPQEEER
ncbi:MAG: DnaB-like helicase C-terminal domain-containing protein [Chloroflexia bacterium]